MIDLSRKTRGVDGASRCCRRNTRASNSWFDLVWRIFFRFVPTRCVAGNIVTGDDSLTEVLVQAGILPKLTLLLSHARTNICKEAAWALSNITAGFVPALLHDTCCLSPSTLA